MTESPAQFRARLESSSCIERPRPGRYWHYTGLTALEGILRIGGIQICTFDNENVCWASADPVWDNAATASLALADLWGAAADLFQPGRELPAARIEVAADVLYEWSSYLWAAGMAIDELLFMQDRAEAIGSNSDLWAVCPRAVPWYNWLAIEAWHGGRWVDLADAPGLEYLATLARVVMDSPPPPSLRPNVHQCEQMAP